MIRLILLALPLLEIATFIVVGNAIGILATIGLVLASGMLGIILIMSRGAGALAQAQAQLRERRDPGPQLIRGAIVFIAAILLIIPGFLTDLFALLLLIPAVRNSVWRSFRRRAAGTTFTAFGGSFGSSRWSNGKPVGRHTIDLDADDYSKSRDPNSPWRLGSDE